MPIRAVCNFVYAHQMHLVDMRSEKPHEDREQLEAELYASPNHRAEKVLRQNQIGG